MNYKNIYKMGDLMLEKSMAELMFDLVKTPETHEKYVRSFYEYWEARYDLRESDPEAYKEILKSKYHNR